MKPWQVSAGLTIATLGGAVILLGEELSYFPTYLLLDHWMPIAWRGGVAVGCLAAALYAAARSLGLAGIGRQTDLTERALREARETPT